MLSIIYVGVLVTWAFVRAAVPAQIALARPVPLSEPFALHLWTWALMLPVMALVALLPVAACIRVLRGRSPAGPLIFYAMLQVTLIIVYFSSAYYLVNQGVLTYEGPPGTLHPIMVPPRTLSTVVRQTIPVYSAPLAAMIALLFPAVRRAIFPRRT